MKVQFNTSFTDVQIYDPVLTKLIGGEDNFDIFLDAYVPSLVTALQRDIETRNDLLVGDYGGVLFLEDKYGEYPFTVVLQVKRIKQAKNLVELTIEQLGFYSVERGREIVQELSQRHGQDDMTKLD